MSELVSILIPAYNAEKWIVETIRSALGQTWPKKEIIIVDDGSSDKTLRIAKTFESNTVKVVTQENMGACGARNEAFRLAQGNYIQWLDADDVLADGKISQQLEGSDSGLTSLVLFTSAYAKFFFRRHKAKFEPNALWQDLAPLDWIVTKFIKNAWMNPTAWLVSRKLIELAGLWNEKLSGSGDDDGEYICRIVSVSEKVKFVPEAKCYYRIGNLGGLSWQTFQRVEPFYQSLFLSINHLLSLENSARTRAACIEYLQRWYFLVYREDNELTKRVNKVVNELGGVLVPPKVSPKFYLFEKYFGWKCAYSIMHRSRKVKYAARREFDRLLYRMHSLRHKFEHKKD